MANTALEDIQEERDDLENPPDMEQILEWSEEGGCEATDGCWVELDGHCPHGRPSWFLQLVLI